jgi:hypothetical protein
MASEQGETEKAARLEARAAREAAAQVDAARRDA